MKSEMPTFRKAICEFQEFLAGQNVSTDLLWVFREDVTSDKRRVLIKEPLPCENIKIVESLYERGCTQGFGLRLDVLCLLHTRPCCYIWLPEDEVDASYAMLSGLKFGVPVNLIDACAVRNHLVWWFYTLHDKRAGFSGLVNELPHRNI